MSEKRKNTRDLIAMGFVCLFLVGMTGFFILDIVPASLDKQQNFPLEPIDINPKWENVPEYEKKPEIPISYEELASLYDQGDIIDVKYVIEKKHIKLYGLQEIVGKNGSYLELRTSILRPESNPDSIFKITGNYIEDNSVIFIETNTDIRFGKIFIVIFNLALLILSIFTFALFLRMLFDKNYKPNEN